MARGPDTSEAIRALTLFVRAHALQESSDTALVYAERAYRMAAAGGSLKNRAITRQLTGVVLEGRGDIEGALEHYMDAVEIAAADTALQALHAKLLVSAAIGHFQLGDLAFGIRRLHRALELLADEDDPALEYGIRGNLATAYTMLGRLDSAIAQLEIAESIASRAEVHPEARVVNLETRANLHDRQGRPQQALTALREALVLAEQHGLRTREVPVLTAIATVEAQRGRYSRSDSLLRAARTRMAQLGNVDYELLLLDAEILLDSLRGRLRPAMASLRRRARLQDSVSGAAAKVRASELEAEYALLQRQRDNDALRLSNLEQTRVNGEQRSQLHLLCALVIGLALLAAQWYRQYRRSRAAEREIAGQATEIAEQRDRIRHELAYSTLLAQEIKHRAKNDLALIAGLLHLQQRDSSDPAAREALERSEHRVRAISLLRSRLERPAGAPDADGPDAGGSDANTDAGIELGPYLRELTDGLLDGANAHYEVRAEDIRLSAVSAVPVGLIVNEAVTNSLKHARPAPGTGLRLRIDVTRDGEWLRLCVRDNGGGYADDPSSRARDRGGLFLTRGLVAQLNGTVRFENDGGAVVHVVIPVDDVLPGPGARAAAHHPHRTPT